MEVTGYAILIDKSGWYLIDYVWRWGKWVCNDADVDFNLVTANNSGELVSLQRLRCHEAAEMLGIWLPPDGNPSKSISVLKQKVN